MSVGDAWRNTQKPTYLRQITLDEDLPPGNERTQREVIFRIIRIYRAVS